MLCVLYIFDLDYLFDSSNETADEIDVEENGPNIIDCKDNGSTSKASKKQKRSPGSNGFFKKLTASAKNIFAKKGGKSKRHNYTHCGSWWIGRRGVSLIGLYCTNKTSIKKKASSSIVQVRFFLMFQCKRHNRIFIFLAEQKFASCAVSSKFYV